MSGDECWKMSSPFDNPVFQQIFDVVKQAATEAKKQRETIDMEIDKALRDVNDAKEKMDRAIKECKEVQIRITDCEASINRKKDRIKLIREEKVDLGTTDETALSRHWKELHELEERLEELARQKTSLDNQASVMINSYNDAIAVWKKAREEKVDIFPQMADKIQEIGQRAMEMSTFSGKDTHSFE